MRRDAFFRRVERKGIRAPYAFAGRVSRYTESMIVSFSLGNLLLYSLIFDAILFGPLCAWLGHEKGRDAVGWFIVGMVFGVIGLLVAIGMPKREKGEPGPTGIKPAERLLSSVDSKKPPDKPWLPFG